MSGYKIVKRGQNPELVNYDYSDSAVSFAFGRAVLPTSTTDGNREADCYVIYGVGPKVPRHEIELGLHFEYMDNIREYFSSVERLNTKDRPVVLSFAFLADRLLPKWRQRTGTITLKELGPAWHIQCAVR